MRYNISVKELIKKGQYTFYSAIIEKIAFLVFFVYLARRSSLAEYGGVVTVFAFTNILANFFELGFSPYFQREASTNNDRIQEALQIALSFKLYVVPFYFAIIFFYFVYLQTSDLTILFLIGTTLYIFSTNLIFTGILYGKNSYFNSFFAFFLSRVFIIISTVLLFLLFNNLRMVFLALLIGSLIHGYFLIKYLYSQNIYVRFGKIRKETFKRIISSSLPIGIGISFVFAYDKIDVLLIERVIGPVAVAFYSVSYSIYKLPQIISSILLVPLFSEFSNIFQDKKRFSIKFLAKPGGVLIVISILMIIGIHLTSKFILSTIYGIKYLSSIWILNSISLALPGLFLNGLTGVTLNSLNKERLVMYSGFISMILNIAINLFLLKRIGIKGAIIATIITEYSNFFIQFVILLKIKNGDGKKLVNSWS